MEISGWFVGENDARIGYYCARDADKLLLASGELAGKEVLLAYDLKFIERVADNRLPIFLVNVAIGERQLKVFENSLIVEQVITLKDEADVAIAQGRPLFGVQLMDGHVVKEIFPGPRLIVHPEDVQQCRLPRA
jgi:hypothetical protein